MADILTENYTGAAALSESLDPGFAFELIEFTLHLNAAATTAEDFTVTKNANNGSMYDTNIYTKDLATASLTDVYFSCEPEEFIFESGDVLDLAWGNTDTKTYGIQVKYRRIS